MLARGVWVRKYWVGDNEDTTLFHLPFLTFILLRVCYFRKDRFYPLPPESDAFFQCPLDDVVAVSIALNRQLLYNLSYEQT